MKVIHDCEVCNKPVPEYVPKYCCNGFGCGCFGLPVEPCICSEECWNKVVYRNAEESETTSSAKKKINLSEDDSLHF